MQNMLIRLGLLILFSTMLDGCASVQPQTSQPQLHHSQDRVSTSGLAYDLVGDGQLLVFIHGSNLDHRLWSEQLKYFQNSASVLAYDLRGLGKSASATTAYSDHSDLKRLIEELGFERASLIGLSAGVQVALDFALNYPAMVNRLVLVSPSINGFNPSQSPAYLPELIAALRASDYETADEVLIASALMDTPSEYQALVRAMITDSGQWRLPYHLMQASSLGVLDNFQNVTHATLILLGGDDLPAITELGAMLSQRLANAHIETLASGNHLLNLSQPKSFHDALDRFFNFQPNTSFQK
ncbi:MAG: hypothetical protein COC19_04780 [SAR86 cluster bacterium]|uniref:AB hydrolase-1 domain-containing protein n=1 Tax=SAR86 cluster bacterium TaxID=2030880 RepID=A0A2A4MNM1_9GAMM|nr:MAG: hypothetical protein COC19_04780 [SAR86 cluster bacterium]